MPENSPEDILVFKRKYLQSLTSASAGLAGLSLLRQRADIDKILSPLEILSVDDARFALGQFLRLSLEQPAARTEDTGEEGDDAGPLALEEPVGTASATKTAAPVPVEPLLRGYS